MPKLPTIVTRGLPSPTEMFVTLVTVHTTPVATLAGPQVDSGIMIHVGSVTSRSLWHVLVRYRHPSAASLPGPLPLHFGRSPNQSSVYSMGMGRGIFRDLVLSQKLSTLDSAPCCRDAFWCLGATTGDSS